MSSSAVEEFQECVEQKEEVATTSTKPAASDTGEEAANEDGDGTPVWTDTRLCGRCQTYSSYIGFRSHCRICGQSICSNCREPEVPDKWLHVPYVHLCRNIPETHQKSMKACKTCAETARQSEADYLWTELLHRTISDDTHAKHWKTMARSKQDNEYMTKAADALTKKYEALTSLTSMEFANCNFSHDKTSHRLIQHDAELHLFDVVYKTKKMEKATEGDISSMTIPFHFATTILSCPGLKDIVAQHIQRQHANSIPCVYQLVAASNRVRVLRMLRPEQVKCLYMHFPYDENVQRALPLVMRGDVDRNRTFIDVLAHMGEQPHEQRAAIVKDLTKVKRPAIMFLGMLRRIATIGYCAPDSFRLTSLSGEAISVFTNVDSNLVQAAACASWPLFRYAFQGLLRLTSGRSVLVVGPSQATLAHSDPADVYKVPAFAGRRRTTEGSGNGGGGGGGGGGIKAKTDEDRALELEEFEGRSAVLCDDQVKSMWALLRTATTGSILLQCVILTILQYTTKKKVDRSRLRFTIDEADRLIVYSAPLLDAGATQPGLGTDAINVKEYMKPEGVQQVRKSCEKLFKNSREYVFWCGTMLNGGELLTDPVKELEPDSPWIFAF